MTLVTAVRFSLIGLLTASVYTTALAIFVSHGVTTLTASAAAYTIAMVFQFFGHRTVTFRSTDDFQRSAIRFLGANAFGLMVSAALSYLFLKVFKFEALFAGATVSIALALINWQVMRKWVFHR